MRPMQIGLAVALILGALSPPGAWAAKAPPPPTVSKEDRVKGMAAAPGLVTTGNLDCEVTDARKLGDNIDPKTKIKSSLYELACKDGEGMVAAQTVDQPPKIFTCLEAANPQPDGKPSTVKCILPDNVDPKAGIAKYPAKAGAPCQIENARGIGHSPEVTAIEIVCRGRPGGYIMQTSAPPRLDKSVILVPCAAFKETADMRCTLTDRATQMSVVDVLATASGKVCTVKDRAYVGPTASGAQYFEVACAEGKGYMLEQGPDGSFQKAIDCIDADTLVGGGCRMTDTRQAKTDQNGLYAKLAKKAGYNCDVSGYAPLPVSADILKANEEVVELTCANRPDGAIGIFPASASETASIYDCAHSEIEGYRCSMSKASAAYDKLTADLVAYGKKSCTVSNARTVGVTADKKGFTEVACSDGLQGYMIEYTVTPLKMTSVIVCSDAKGIAGGCTLPGNTGKKS